MLPLGIANEHRHAMPPKTIMTISDHRRPIRHNSTTVRQYPGNSINPDMARFKCVLPPRSETPKDRP